MKIRQTIRHWAAKQALTTPVIRDIAKNKLVALHTRIFLGRADPATRDHRRDHLEAFFDRTIDIYVTALKSGYSEAESREITHILANFDFFNHGWTEMMEIPSNELEQHYERYQAFFKKNGVTITDPLGDFQPSDLPEAPSTPGKLEVTEHPYAEGGFADDVYVETTSGEVSIGGSEEPENVDVTDAPGLNEEDTLNV